jgi:ribosomal protein L7/L12
MSNVEYFLMFLLALNVIATFLSNTRRLQDIEHKLNLVLAHLDIDPTALIAPSNHVIALATDPLQRIAAIKAYRQQTGAGLKDAVAMINKIASDAKG